MHHRVPRLHGVFFKLRTLFSEELIALLLVLFVFAVPAGATTRFENRSLFMASTLPSETTSYKLSLDYMTLESVGSLDLQFCVSPIPYEACVKPTGLNISQAVLESQTGETGFRMQILSDTHIILSRSPQMIAGVNSKSTYTLNNIVNPTYDSSAFAVRMKSFSSTNATGTQIDFGSVRGQIGDGITIETQVPPMLIFCAAQVVDPNCLSTNDTYFSDLGTLSTNSTLTGQSQMAVGTNASGGFSIAVSGPSMTAGTNVIQNLETPTTSQPGKNQFGINLVENDELGVGSNPEGEWMNAVASPDYAQPNRYKYVDGDVVAYSPNVSLIKKFTVSYIVNVSPSLRAGVYTTTINFIASGQF